MADHYIAPDGNSTALQATYDAATDQDEPCSIDVAAEYAGPGDTNLIKGGQYDRSSLGPVVLAGIGTAGAPVKWIGRDENWAPIADLADGPVIDTSEFGTQAHVVQALGQYHLLSYLTARGNPAQHGRGFHFGKVNPTTEGMGCKAFRCLAYNTGIWAFHGRNEGNEFIGCEAHSFGLDGTEGIGGIVLDGYASGVRGCYIHDAFGISTGPGIMFRSGYGQCADSCIVTGLKNYGYLAQQTFGTALQVPIKSCIAHACSAGGFATTRTDGGGAEDVSMLLVLHNCLAVKCGGAGVLGLAPGAKTLVTMLRCAFFGNAQEVDESLVTPWEPEGRTSLTADPFVDAENDNFRLTGAAIAELGFFPEMFLSGGIAQRLGGHPPIAREVLKIQLAGNLGLNR